MEQKVTEVGNVGEWGLQIPASKRRWEFKCVVFEIVSLKHIIFLST